jgi:hypothetical protein
MSIFWQNHYQFQTYLNTGVFYKYLINCLLQNVQNGESRFEVSVNNNYMEIFCARFESIAI